MAREEIIKKIQEVEEGIMYEEFADIGYNFDRVANYKARLRELKEMLKELDK